MLGPIVLLRGVGGLCKRAGTCIVRVSVGDHIVSFQRPLTTERKYIVLSSGQRCRLHCQSLLETHADFRFPSVCGEHRLLRWELTWLHNRPCSPAVLPGYPTQCLMATLMSATLCLREERRSARTGAARAASRSGTAAGVGPPHAAAAAACQEEVCVREPIICKSGPLLLAPRLPQLVRQT